jgi:hypothetical protein
MKKLSFIFVMLAAVLVPGLAFISCGDDNNYDKSIEELFKRVKSESRGMLIAVTTADEEFYYCSGHQRWEMTDNHTIAANFKLADVVLLRGYYWPTLPAAAYISSITKMIWVLDSFYDLKYKTNKAQLNPVNAPDGTTVYGWYYFRLYRNGNGYYGGTIQTSQTPLWTDHYYFD